MSLQDDYFDLSESLEGWQKEAFQRIWDAFVDMESEHEKLLEIRGAVRKMVELTFPSEEKQKEMVLVDDSASTVDEMKRKIGLGEPSAQPIESASEIEFAKLIEEANEYMSCMSVSVSEHGLSVELVLDTSISTHGEWIKEEGGDICLLRCSKTNRVVGCNLPLMNRRLSVHYDGPIVINDGFRVEKHSEKQSMVKIADAVENLTMSQWKRLMLYERKIIESGVDGGKQKSVYIDELRELEMNYGVFVNDNFWMDDQPSMPRWQSKPSHLCGK